MSVNQVVQVKIMGTHRLFTYGYTFDPQAGGRPLALGDKVELPPNIVQEEGSSGTVAKYGSDYTGPMKMIVRKIEPKAAYEPFATGPDEMGVRKRPADDDLWGGMDVR